MKKIKHLIISSLLLLLIGFVGCEYKTIVPDKGDPVDPEVPISFSAEVEPIWTSQGCVSCHPSAGGLDLTVGNAHASLMSHPRAINKDNSSESTILTFKTVQPGPHGSVDYVGNQSEIIKVWIDQGALDN
ncbi:hypothetical protein [Carboxylicivirga sp. N1Y90]|uniref:hypothetical protein n=1 Tax=Carboxylicivirga fragile TaxID=3417571 RepID=UPI003D3286E9|nr:hypothetical protein [Marinilabiliaceae bacterium N1Y90]